jgi:hypothetical protein
MGMKLHEDGARCSIFNVHLINPMTSGKLSDALSNRKCQQSTRCHATACNLLESRLLRLVGTMVHRVFLALGLCLDCLWIPPPYIIDGIFRHIPINLDLQDVVATVLISTSISIIDGCRR